MGDNPPTVSSPGVLLNNKTYDILKFVAQILLPALGTLYFALSSIWGLPDGQQVVGSITAVDVFLGLVLGLSSQTYNNSDVKYDGTVHVTDNGDGTGLINLEPTTHPAEFDKKGAVTFKVSKKVPDVETAAPLEGP